MPRLSDRVAIGERIAAIRADRARGLTFTEIGRRHGVSHQFAFWCARHVTVELVHRRWHLARWNKPDAPSAAVRAVHEIRGGRWAG